MYEKYFNALTLIPIEILRQFPKFDVDSFENLKTLTKRIKAKTLRIGKNLKEVKESKEKEKLSNSSDNFPSVDDFDDFDVESTSAITPSANTTFESPSLTYVSLTERIRRENDVNVPEKLARNLNETNFQSSEVKKSSFKVKRPVKTKMEMTSELCDKDPQFQKVNNVDERRVDSPSIRLNESGNFEMKSEFRNNYETPDKAIMRFNKAVPSSSKSNLWMKTEDNFGNYIFQFLFNLILKSS